MTQEELMIGDIVNVHRCECVADGGHFQEWNEYGKVVSITEDYITIKYIGREDDYGFEDVNEEDINPIPLTPEILEKNGFIGDKNVCKTKVRDDLKDELWQCEYAWYLKNLRIKNRTNSSVARLYNIMFVHELQHALRLCNVSKEIEI